MAQVQMGNHYKRVGRFPEAVDVLEKAIQSNHERVGVSSIADVWAEQGDYDRAVKVYTSIAGWQRVPEVRTALADIMRYQGEIPEAAAEYEAIRPNGRMTTWLLRGRLRLRD